MPAADKCIVTAGYALPVLGCQGQAVIISCFAWCTCGTGGSVGVSRCRSSRVCCCKLEEECVGTVGRRGDVKVCERLTMWVFLFSDYVLHN